MLDRIKKIIRSESGDKGLRTTSNMLLGAGGMLILLKLLGLFGYIGLAIGIGLVFVGFTFRK